VRSCASFAARFLSLRSSCDFSGRRFARAWARKSENASISLSFYSISVYKRPLASLHGESILIFQISDVGVPANGGLAAALILVSLWGGSSTGPEGAARLPFMLRALFVSHLPRLFSFFFFFLLARCRASRRILDRVPRMISSAIVIGSTRGS